MKRYVELKRERARDEAAAAVRNRTRGPVQQLPESSGRRDMAIPMDAFLRAQQLNGTDCWEDPEFTGDMLKREPHIAVPQAGKISVCLAGRVPRRRDPALVGRWVHRDGKLVRVA